ncbi:MAG: hypothetical protein KBA51_07790 [Kiritimatiellae bacterium]|nr:hypothetical protein [Kiritimatiellia bacterium]
MRSKQWIVAVTLVAMGVGAGCQSAGPRSNTAEDREIVRYLRAGQSPQSLSLTVYQDQGERWLVVNGTRVAPHQQAHLSFASPAGSPIALLNLVGPKGTVQALVDPSSPRSWTCMAFAKALKLTPVNPPALVETPVHVIDSRGGVLSVCPELLMDRLQVKNVLLYARTGPATLWPVSRTALAGDAKLVLGYDFLRSLSWAQWDFEGRMWTASTSEPYVPDPESVVATLPLEAGADGMTVRAIVDSKPRQVLLDLAGDYEMAMEAPPMELIRQVTLDDLVLRGVRAVSTQDLGLGRPDIVRIGLRLLSRFQITLDVHRNVVHLEIPPGARAAPDAREEDAAENPDA